MTFLSSSKSKRLKEALERADNEILKLKDQVKSLQESNKQLCVELATSRDKVDDLAARFHDIEREKRKRGQEQQGTGSSEQHGVGDGASVEESKEQSPMNGDDSIGEEAQIVVNDEPNKVGKDKQLNDSSNTSSNINCNEDKGKEMSDEPNDTHKEGELILQINELTKRNQELEAKVISLSDERERLVAITTKDDEVAGSPSVSFEIAEKKEEALIIPKSTPGGAGKQQTNQELEAQVASLTIERDKLVTMLAKEKNKSQVASLTIERDKLVSMLAKEKNKSKQRRDEAKERRKRFQDKLSKMSDKLKGDFDDEEDTDET